MHFQLLYPLSLACLLLLDGLVHAQVRYYGRKGVTRIELAGILASFDARVDPGNRGTQKQTAMLINGYDDQDQLINQSICVDEFGEIARQYLKVEDDEVRSIKPFPYGFEYVVFVFSYSNNVFFFFKSPSGKETEISANLSINS